MQGKGKHSVVLRGANLFWIAIWFLPMGHYGWRCTPCKVVWSDASLLSCWRIRSFSRRKRRPQSSIIDRAIHLHTRWWRCQFDCPTRICQGSSSSYYLYHTQRAGVAGVCIVLLSCCQYQPNYNSINDRSLEEKSRLCFRVLLSTSLALWKCWFFRRERERERDDITDCGRWGGLSFLKKPLRELSAREKETMVLIHAG